MTQREATLQEILENRESRVRRQGELLAQYGKSLISFTMNIPGPVKYSDLIRAGFRLGLRLLTDLLASAGFAVVFQEERLAVTGCEAFLVVDADEKALKQLTLELEDGVPLGRLLDLDVLSPDGRKFSREDLGFEPRKCLICHRPARHCGPIRAHSAQELVHRAEQILTQAVYEDRSRTIGSLAVKSLLYEVAVTPKPGLVDRVSNGAHTDMDIFTFLSSAPALQPYFTQCARLGMETRLDPPEETFRRIRFQGKLAEQTMFRATGGVNTHKGAVFILGLACAAAGRLVFTANDPESILAQCAEMTRGLVERDLEQVTQGTARTAGERFYLLHGVTGIRGQAQAGFPAVLHTGLPTLERGLEQGLSMDRAAGAALLAILAATDDTNLISRGSRETQLALRKQMRALLADDPWPDENTLANLDRAFTEQHLSPGGSADLLALALYLHFVKGGNSLLL